VLATLDPIGALAERDTDQLRDLVASVATNNAAVQAFLDRLTPPRVTKPEDPGARFPDAKARSSTVPLQSWVSCDCVVQQTATDLDI